ncbi:hypothetical protein NHX12_008023 [Muraenolepis orangiensis]|uniref:Uncharacterized protein n=1 Tax=Muraenolepis orangiensis TaxID=630683 RepID=A0A9Q0IAW2_9TELE|nr:hypothetical protein NHX12_008023 [Muraenolepis orangiensis]
MLTSSLRGSLNLQDRGDEGLIFWNISGTQTSDSRVIFNLNLDDPQSVPFLRVPSACPLLDYSPNPGPSPPPNPGPSPPPNPVSTS